MGIVHHSRYLPMMEEARVAYLRHIGHPYQSIRDEGIDIAVLEVFLQYRLPLRFDELVDVHVSIAEIGRATFQMAYAMTVAGELRATAITAHGCITPDGRPTRLPAWFRGLRTLPTAPAAPSRARGAGAAAHRPRPRHRRRATRAWWPHRPDQRRRRRPPRGRGRRPPRPDVAAVVGLVPDDPLGRAHPRWPLPVRRHLVPTPDQLRDARDPRRRVRCRVDRAGARGTTRWRSSSRCPRGRRGRSAASPARRSR